jgi:XisH protein
MARDKFHEQVRNALETEGWIITDDPLYIKLGTIPIHIDLGAERLIAAEKGSEKIAVEVKTFGMTSFITAFHEAVDKYLVYREALVLKKIDRALYLALPNDIFETFQDEPLVRQVFAEYNFKVLTYDPITQHIVSWLKEIK